MITPETRADRAKDLARVGRGELLEMLLDAQERDEELDGAPFEERARRLAIYLVAVRDGTFEAASEICLCGEDRARMLDERVGGPATLEYFEPKAGAS